jgi:hypothetical protein
MKKILILILIGVVLSFTIMQSASAANFDKNFLIDNSLFTSANSMSVSQIQSFLNDNGSLLANWTDDVDMRRPSDDCIVHHATGMTAAEIIYEAATNWGAQVYDSNGCAIEDTYWSDPGYSNYVLDTISPKALLVILQKEQSLISANGGYSSNWRDYQDPTCCSSNEYKLARAMGYGVPDSGSINEKYLGFYNQINWASWQLRFNYERAAGNTGWDEVGYITYAGPMIAGNHKRCASCATELFDGYYNIDGSPLYMENQATASLYYYTPHTYPGYFGNYNFVQFYTNWFGSIYGVDYHATLHSKCCHIENELPGTSHSQNVQLKNSGNVAWYDSQGLGSAPAGTKPVRLVTAQPQGHSSIFGSEWGNGKNNVAVDFSAVYESDGITLASNQHMVEVGQIASWDFNMVIPADLKAGSYREFFKPIVFQTSGTFADPYVFIKADVRAGLYKSQVYEKCCHVDDALHNEILPSYLMLENIGNMPWYDKDSISSAPAGTHAVRLSTAKSFAHSSLFGKEWGQKKNVVSINFSEVYESDGTTLASNQDVVQPGQVAKWEFNKVVAESIPEGNYREFFQAYRFGVPNGGFNDPYAFLKTSVENSDYTATMHSKCCNTTGNSPGDVIPSYVMLKNDGNVSWYDTQSLGSAPSGTKAVRLITGHPMGNSSDFGSEWGSNNNNPGIDFTEVYESDGSTLASNQHIVEPGQIARWEFNIVVPNNYPTGNYRDFFQPLLFKSSLKFNDPYVFIKTDVN